MSEQNVWPVVTSVTSGLDRVVTRTVPWATEMHDALARASTANSVPTISIVAPGASMRSERPGPPSKSATNVPRRSRIAVAGPVRTTSTSAGPTSPARVCGPIGDDSVAPSATVSVRAGSSRSAITITATAAAAAANAPKPTTSRGTRHGERATGSASCGSSAFQIRTRER